jgi:hypothetical protein
VSLVSASRRRLIALVAVVIYGGLFAQSGLHALTTEHVVCAEHGELVHGNGHGVAATDVAEHATWESVPAADDHGHCDHVHIGGVTVATAAATPVSAPIVAATSGNGGGDLRRGSPQLATLALAPKTSPPA